MDQIPAQPATPQPVTESPELTKELKSARSAGWAITSIGYVYLLMAVIAGFSLMAGITAFSYMSSNSLPAFNGLAIFILLIAIIPFVTALGLCISLVVLGRRIIGIEKGVMWKAGGVKPDADIKKYFLLATLLAGSLLLAQLVAGRLSMIDLVLAGALFGYSLNGFFAAGKLLAMPEFISRLQPQSYKTTAKFWSILVSVIIILQIAMVGFSVYTRNKARALKPAATNVPVIAPSDINK